MVQVQWNSERLWKLQILGTGETFSGFTGKKYPINGAIPVEFWEVTKTRKW